VKTLHFSQCFNFSSSNLWKDCVWICLSCAEWKLNWISLQR